jgi:hypothetical protein
MRSYTTYSFPSSFSGNTRTYQTNEIVIAENSKGKILIGLVVKNKGYINDDTVYSVKDFAGQVWDVQSRLIKWSIPLTSPCYNEFLIEIKTTTKHSVKEYKDMYLKMLTIKNALYYPGDYVYISSINDFGIIKSVGCSHDNITPEYVISTIHNGDKFFIETAITKSSYDEYKRAYDSMNFTQPNEHLAKAMYQIERLDEQVNYLMGESLKARDDIKSISAIDQKVILSDDCCIPKVDALEEKLKKHEKRTKLLVALGAAFI